MLENSGRLESSGGLKSSGGSSFILLLRKKSGAYKRQKWSNREGWTSYLLLMANYSIFTHRGNCSSSNRSFLERRKRGNFQVTPPLPIEVSAQSDGSMVTGDESTKSKSSTLLLEQSQPFLAVVILLVCLTKSKTLDAEHHLEAVSNARFVAQEE